MTEEKKPSLMIATPMYGGMCTGAYVQGLLMTMAKMREIGVNVAWCQITNESLITVPVTNWSVYSLRATTTI